MPWIITSAVSLMLPRYQPEFICRYPDGRIEKGPNLRVSAPGTLPTKNQLPVQMTLRGPQQRISEYCGAGGSSFVLVSDRFRTLVEAREAEVHYFHPIEIVLTDGRRAPGAYHLFLVGQVVTPLQSIAGNVHDPLCLAEMYLPMERLSAAFPDSRDIFHALTKTTMRDFAYSIVKRNPRFTCREFVDVSKVRPLFPFLNWTKYRRPKISLFELGQMIPLLWRQTIDAKHVWRDDLWTTFVSDSLKEDLESSLLRLQFLQCPAHDICDFSRAEQPSC